MKIKLLLIAFVVVQLAWSQDYKYGKVSKEELLETEHAKYPDANAAVLYREFKTDFRYSSEDGFYYVTEVFERIKIYNKEGYDQATKVFSLYQGSRGNKEDITSLKGSTYFLNGSKVEKTKLGKEGIFDSKVNEYYEEKKLTMPNLKEGCVIEYKYKLESPFTNSIDEYRFQEKIPVNKVSLLFKVPEYLNYKTHQKGSIHYKIVKNGAQRNMEYKYIQRAVTSGGGADKTITSTITFLENSYLIKMDDVAPMVEEAYAGNINNYLSGIKFELAYTKYPNSNLESYATDWNFVAKSIYDSPSFGTELDKTNYFKNDIDKLLSGVSNEDDKMMLIFNFVKTKMNWNSFIGKYVSNGVKTAYKEGEGNTADINLMLTSMFRYAKLNANPVLVSTKNNGIPIIATRNGFNYVIAAVEVNNGVYLFDATDKKSLPNLLNPRIINWQGRLIREDGSSAWVPLVPKKHAIDNIMITATINDDLEVIGNVKERITGHYALNARESYSGINNDGIRKLLEKERLETEMSNVEIKDLEDLSKPIGISYDFESYNLVEEIDGKLYFSPMLFIGEKGNPFKLEERNYPVDFEFPKKMRALIKLTIPEGYKVESIPEVTSFSFGDNDCVFRYTGSNTANQIQLNVEFSVNQPLVSANDYKNLKGFFQLMVEKQNEKVVLVKE